MGVEGEWLSATRGPVPHIVLCTQAVVVVREKSSGGEEGGGGGRRREEEEGGRGRRGGRRREEEEEGGEEGAGIPGGDLMMDGTRLTSCGGCPRGPVC